MPRKLFLYIHTHWDREWYQPFQTFRAQLLELVRFLLPRLESGDIPRFYLDGQAIILEDVLEVEPQHATTISELMSAGKLYAGPWYVLPDEILVSGESLIRNLEHGLALCSKFGEPALIGYCPDTFGHSADLPNILRGFGITNAVVWRGVPELPFGPLFQWQSPDGSRVTAYHLTRGYYQTAFHELASVRDNAAAVKGFAQTLPGWVSSVGGKIASPFCSAIDGALMPIGADHVAPPAGLQSLIDDVNAAAEAQVELVPATLPEFLRLVEEKSGDDLPLVEGELRFNRAASSYERAYLLPGVLSTRLYLKRENRLSEWRLARLAEPLRAMMNVIRRTPGTGASELHLAWKLLLQNSPHDSICGCSVDSVHEQMRGRTAELNHLLDAVIEKVAVDASNKPHSEPRLFKDPDVPHERLTVFNVGSASVSAPVYASWLQNPGTPPIKSSCVQIEKKRCEDLLLSGWGAVPYYKQVDVYEGWVWAADVPMLGFRSLPWRPDAGIKPDESPVTVSGSKLSNGILTISAGKNGQLVATLNLPDRAPIVYSLGHNIFDVADGGDTYNFDPLPEDKPLSAKLTNLRAGKRGPLVGSLIATYEIDLPEGVEDKGPLKKDGDAELSKIRVLRRSSNKIKHQIEVEISLHCGVPIVYFDARWENKSSDHRMEVSFVAGEQIKETFSESHLGIVRRAHNLPGLRETLPVPVAHEAHPDRFPAQRFVVANRQVFFNTGMPEYAVDDDRLSMTMLRAVSYLSKPRLWTRGGGAGPNVVVPGANCHGINHCSYGWAPLMVRGETEMMQEAFKLAQTYEGQLWCSIGTGRLNWGDGVDARSLFHIDSAQIKVIALYERDGATIMRLLNVGDNPVEAVLRINFDVQRVDEVSYGGHVQQSLEISAVDMGSRVNVSFGARAVKTLSVVSV